MSVEKSYFFDSVNGDRNYTAKQFLEYFSLFLTDGVRNGGYNLKVVENAGYTVKVLPGEALVNTHAYILEADDIEPMLLPIEYPDALPRKDRIVLRSDNSANERRVYLAVVKGDTAKYPAPPEREVGQNDPNIKEIVLATIDVLPHHNEIIQKNIFDERLTKNCGLINSTIQLDTADLLDEL